MPDPNDFWPEAIIDPGDPPPVALLKEQAALLGGKTGSVVEGLVRSSTEGGTAYYSLYLKADALGDYLYKLLYIAHPAIGSSGDAFPLTAQNSFGGLKVTLRDQGSFRDWLRKELSSDDVRRAISNLMRYVRESGRTPQVS